MLTCTKKALLLSLFLLITASGFPQKITTLSGDITGLDSGSVIHLNSVSGQETADSTIAVNGKFNFSVNAQKGDAYFCNFKINTQRIDWPVYMNAGSNVQIRMVDNSKLMIFSGSQIAEDQNNFYAGLSALTDEINFLNEKLKNEKDSTLNKKLTAEIAALNNKYEPYYLDWVSGHENSPFSIAVIYLYVTQTPMDTLEKLYNKISSQAKENNYLDYLMPRYFADRKVNERFKPGTQMEDFGLNDTGGISHSFKSLQQNNYVLIDIWASWCGPCRKSTPEISKLLKTYADKNFTVISISADDEIADWKKAIKNDNMNWYQLSDLKGTDSGFMKQNNIFAYPTYIIISPEGTILSKPYNVDRVKDVLKEIFANNF